MEVMVSEVKPSSKAARKTVILIALGAYLISMGLLMRFWAYQRLAVVPKDQNTQQTLVSQKDARFFDADTVSEGTGQLTTNLRVIGDADQAKSVSKQLGQNVVVLEKGQSTDNNNQAPPMDYLQQRFALGAHSSKAVKWSDATQDGQYTKFSGYLIKFPFNTQKKSYPYWDSNIRKPMTMKFKGVRTVKGTTGSIKTYYFEGTVPRTIYTTREVPRQIFGLEDRAVDADRSYAVTRKLWVEPQTGVFMKVEEDQQQWLTIPDPGAKEVTALDANLVMTPKTVQSNIDAYKVKALLLHAVRVFLPIGMLVLGLVSILAGVLAYRRSGSAGRGHSGRGTRAERELSRLG